MYIRQRRGSSTDIPFRYENQYIHKNGDILSWHRMDYESFAPLHDDAQLIEIFKPPSLYGGKL